MSVHSWPVWVSDVSLASLGPHHCPRPPGAQHGAWGRSRSVPERWSDCQLTGGQSHPHHGGSYLLRARPPLARLGRQFSVSSDYVAASTGGLARLYEPSYNYPSFHGISDSLLATVGDHTHRQYPDSDFFSLHHDPTPPSLYPERRKKTVRFNSVSDRELYDGPEGHGLPLGWMTGGLRARHCHLWDRQESQDSTARSDHASVSWSLMENSINVKN